jgi:hypothetical protein
MDSDLFLGGINLLQGGTVFELLCLLLLLLRSLCRHLLGKDIQEIHQLLVLRCLDMRIPDR